MVQFDCNCIHIDTRNDNHDSIYIFHSSALVIGCRSDKSITTVNAAPKVSITSHQDGSRVPEGEIIEIRTQVSDTNHDVSELEVIWYYGIDEICPWAAPDAGGGTACDITPNLDDDTVRVEVRDIEGAGASNAVVLSVFETNAPQLKYLEPLTSGVYYSDQKVTFGSNRRRRGYRRYAEC